MYYLVYVSAATTPFSEGELLELLETSRRNNAPLGITGMLLYKDGRFMQLLEGQKEPVLKLVAKVAADPRHCKLTVLLEGERAGRECGAWSMGFQRLDTPDAQQIPGYSDIFHVPLDSESFASNASQCLRMFLAVRKPTAQNAQQLESVDRYRYWGASRPVAS